MIYRTCAMHAVNNVVTRKTRQKYNTFMSHIYMAPSVPRGPSKWYRLLPGRPLRPPVAGPTVLATHLHFTFLFFWCVLATVTFLHPKFCCTWLCYHIFLIFSQQNVLNN